MQKKFIVLVFLALITMYFFAATYQIRLPGYHSDEAVEFNCSYSLFNKLGHLPIAIHRFEGGMGACLLTPFLYFFPENPVISLRMGNIAYSILVLVLTYLFIKEFLKREFPALLITSLMAWHPSFLLSAKIGSQTCLIVTLFMMAALLFFLKWFKTNKIFYFSLGFFFLGFGLGYRIHFLWFVVALAITTFILFKMEIYKIISKRCTYYLTFAFFSFCAGAFNFIWYNVKYNFYTIKQLFYWTFISRETIYGADHFDYFNNLYKIIHNLFKILNGKFIFTITDMGLEEYYPRLNIGNLMVILFIIVSLWMVVSIFIKNNHFISVRKKMFLIFLYLIILVQTPFTPSMMAQHHLLILLPLSCLILFVGLFDVMNNFIVEKKAIIIVFCTFLVITVINLCIISRFYKGLALTGGNNRYSDSIYELSDWLLKNDKSQIVAIGYDLSTIYVLTKGKISPISLYSEIENAKFKRKIEGTFEKNRFNQISQKIFRNYFENKENLYIVSMYDALSFQQFQNAVMKYGKQIREIKKFYQRDGRPAYMLISLI